MHKMGSDDCVAVQEAQRRRPYRKGSTDTKIKPGSNFKRQSPVASQTSYHDIFTPYYRDIRIVLNNHISSLRSLSLCWRRNGVPPCWKKAIMGSAVTYFESSSIFIIPLKFTENYYLSVVWIECKGHLKAKVHYLQMASSSHDDSFPCSKLSWSSLEAQ